MATLLQGNKKEANGGDQKLTEQQTDPRTEQHQQGPLPAAPLGYRKLIRISLFIADALLFALAARVAFKSGGSFGFSEAALCASALLMGAWLTVVAIQMKS
jgi:hypothetical protein